MATKTQTSAGMETPDETVSRIQAARENAGDAPLDTGGGQDEFLTELQNRLMNQAEAVSSSDSQIQKAISGAISSTREANQANTQRIESQFSRAGDEVLRQGQYTVDDFAEARSGFATQMIGLRQVTETVDKNLNDLAQRKEELILQGNAAAANQITQLQLQGLEMRQEAQQRVFNNLMSMSNFGLSAAQFEEQQRQFDLSYELEGKRFNLAREAQSFTEKQAMSQVALEFGLALGPNDTIDTVVERAKNTGIVDERRNLELEKIRAEIRNANAQAARAARGNLEEDEELDPMTAEVLARGARNGMWNPMEVAKNQKQLAAIVTSMEDIDQGQLKSIQNIAANSNSLSEFRSVVDQMKTGAPAAEQENIERLASKVAANASFAEGQGGSTLREDLSGIGEGIDERAQSVADYLEIDKSKLNNFFGINTNILGVGPFGL